MESNDQSLCQFQDCKQIFTVLETLNSQRSSSKLCDVILKISDEQIYAHSNILASASPYFDSVFSCHDLPRAFSQKMPQVIEIHIDGPTDPAYITAVEKVVDFMYTSRIQLDCGTITQVLEIARIMEMDNIIDFCTFYQQGNPDIIEQVKNRYKISKDMVTQTADEAESVDKEIVVFNGKGYNNKWTFKKNLKPKPIIFNVGTGNRKRGRGRPRKRAVGDTEIDTVESSYLPDEERRKDVVSPKTENDETYSEVTTANGPEENLQNSAKEPSVRVSRHGRVIKPKKFSDDVVSYIKDEPLSDTENDTENNYLTNIGLIINAAEKQEPGNTDFLMQALEGEPVKKFACELCDYTTSKMKEFNDHHREHLHAEKKCSYCGWVCDNPDITEDEFREHLNNHKGSALYFCTFCSQRFNTKARLYQHLPKHSKTKPYVCDICQAGFKWKHALKTHMTVHKGSKDYLCDICGFSTAHKTQLKAHHLIHTGNTFKCPELGCEYQSTKRSNLKFHMMTHSREKPHQCEYCGQSFSLVKNMKRHMLLHKSDRPFRCERCSFCTTRFDKLKEHYFKQHQIGEKPKKKVRLTEYLKMQAMMENLADQLEGEQLEGNVINIGEDMETIELQVAEDGDGLATTQIVNVTSSTGEAIPITITQNDGEVSYEIQHYPVQIVAQEVVTECETQQFKVVTECESDPQQYKVVTECGTQQYKNI